MRYTVPISECTGQLIRRLALYYGQKAQFIKMTDTQLTQSQSILLDLIRYFLAAVVVIGHGFGFFLGYFDGFFPRVFPHPQSIAVVCFFYLSGFLIVGSQIRQSDRAEGSLGKYLLDRTTRVYVTLIPSLIFVVAVDLSLQKLSAANVELVTNYASLKIFIDNLFLIPSMPYGTMRPIWSLMYEWWIYLLFGGLYYLKSNRVSALLLILAGAYYTLKVNASGEAGHIWIIWALGGVCAHLQQKISWKDLNRHALDALALLLLIAAGWLYFISKSAYNLPAGIFLALFLFIFTNKVSRFLRLLLPLREVAKKIAGFSFTLFLTHYTILIYTNELLRLDGWAGLIAGFAISNLVAASIAFFSEYRLTSIKMALRNMAENHDQGKSNG